MAQLIRTARAEEDLIEVWLYIAQDNLAAADRLLDKIDATAMRLAENPRMGTQRPDLAIGLRYFAIGNYLILYREIENGIELVRIVHGARYLPDMV